MEAKESRRLTPLDTQFREMFLGRNIADGNLEATEIGLRALSNSLEQMEDELNHIHRAFRRSAYSDLRDCVYVDFDIIYSAFNWLSRPKRPDNTDRLQSFWSSLCLALLDEQARILPGTLDEVSRFLENNRNSADFLNNSARDRSKFQLALHQAITDLSPNSLADNQYFIASMQDAVRGFRDSVVQSVLKPILRDDLYKEINNSRQCFDEKQFSATYFALKMDKKRRDQYLNNRVDALNFSMLTGLNHQDAVSQDPVSRHLLVTNTVILQRLTPPDPDNIVHYALTENGVVGPRKMCLYLILRDAAEGDAARAEEATFELLESTRRLLRLTSEIRSHLRAGSAKEIISSDFSFNADPFHVLFLDFDWIQRRVNEVQKSRERVITLADRSFSHDQFREFCDYAIDKTNAAMHNSVYLRVIKDGNYEMQVEELERIEEVSLQRAFRIYSHDTRKGNIFVSGGDFGLRFWFDIEFDFKRFAEIVEDLRNNVFDDVFSQATLQSRPKTFNLAAAGQEGRWLVGLVSGEEITVEAPMISGVDQSINECIKRRNSGEDIDFMRYWCPLFSTTYDGKLLGVRTPLKIDRLVKEFVCDARGIGIMALNTETVDSAVKLCIKEADLYDLEGVLEEYEANRRGPLRSMAIG